MGNETKRKCVARWSRRWALLATCAALAAGCGSEAGSRNATPAIVITAPGEGAIVDTFQFAVRATLPIATIDPTSINVRINASAVDFQLSGTDLSAAVEPGPPLRDDNELVISALDLRGREITARSSFQYLPPKARVHRITSDQELLRGPMAQNRVGDYLLDNAVARFVVQDVGRRDFANVGTYGGNLIDAELLADPGRDNFFEIVPMVNIETVVNAQRAEIVNDGEDGTAAILRTCGPDDLLDFINPSASIGALVGLMLPASIDDADYDIEGCTDYVLEPGDAHVAMVTTIFNNQDDELGLFVGDIIAGAGSLDPWLVSARNRNAIGEVLLLPVSALDLIGFDDSERQDYQYVPVPLPGSPFQTSDVLTISGVDAVLHSHSVIQAIAGAKPTFVVPAHGSNSYSRYFGVGNGSGGNAIDLANRVLGLPTGTISGCVTSAGAPSPRARVAVGPSSNGTIVDLATHFVTGDDGCFSGTLAPGSYGAAAAQLGTPFENDSPAPLVHNFTLAAGDHVQLNFELPATSAITVHVLDQDGNPMPARVTLVGFDDSPEPRILTPVLADTASSYLFRDLGLDGTAYGIADVAYAGADGEATLTAEPGTYYVAVSRGWEFSLYSEAVELVAGSTRRVDARLAHVLDTDGFVSSDFHVHGLSSTDCRVSNARRAAQYAGEGVDNIVMTDHHGRTDLAPTIAALGLERFLTSTIGEEITTGDYGHYNGYPFDLVPDHQTGGAVDWGRPAPPGRDFPRYGAYTMTPAELDAEAHSAPGHRASTVVQANHVDNYYGPLKIDSSLVPPQSFLSAAEKRALRLDPDTGNLFHDFAAMEIWNGYGRRHQEKFFGSHIGIWFNLLNQGIITTGTGVTDNHGFSNLNAAGARTWTASAVDDPRAIDSDEVAHAVAEGRATVGQGAYLEVRLDAADDSGAHASHHLGDPTLVTTSNGKVDLEVRVQSPLWAGFDTVAVYANSPTFPTGQVGGINYQFSANPTLVLHAGDDFTVERINVAPSVVGGERWEANLVIPITGLTVDTWFVVVARGTDGISPPLFPVAASDISALSNLTPADLMDGNLGEGGVLALAIANPLYADVDGVPGFQAPLAPR